MGAPHSALAQQAEPTAAESVIDVPSVTGRILRLLRQADALLADAQWEDALETLQTVIENESGELVEASPGRYTPLLDACHARIARLPSDALAQYRRRVDPIAQRLLEQGRSARQPQPLRRLIDEYFCSSHGDDALLLLSDLALERGDYALARRALQRLHPALTGPGGRPVGLAVRGIDLDAHWPDVQAALLEPRAHAVPAIYPDADGAVGEALARLVVVSVRERSFERAATEIDLLKRLAPGAAGRIAGRDTELAPALAEMAASAGAWPEAAASANWPTFGGDPQRRGVGAPVGDLAGALWPQPHEVDPVGRRLRQSLGDAAPEQHIIQRDSLGRLAVRDAEAPATHPAVYGRWVLARDGRTLMALDLASGQPAVTRQGVLYRAAVGLQAQRRVNVQQFGGLRIMNAQIGGRFAVSSSSMGIPEGPLSVVDGVLYARVAPANAEGVRGDEHAAGPRIRGFDLTRDGLETTKLSPPAAPWRFSGPPLVHGGRLYVALAADEVRPRVAVACYSATYGDGEPLWLTPLGAGPPSAGAGDERPPDVLTMAGESLYLNTNFGAVAALDAASGRAIWVREYDRHEGETTFASFPAAAHTPAPCVYDRGHVYVAPVDSPYVFALDAATGHTLWATRAAGAAHGILGVTSEVLVTSGRSLTGIDTRDGAVRYQWPDSPDSGIRGMGRGCLAGDEVFWPTRDAIYVVESATGATSRPPVDLSPYGGRGANLTPAHGLLVVSTSEAITVLGPFRAESSQPDQAAKVSAREPRN